MWFRRSSFGERHLYVRSDAPLRIEEKGATSSIIRGPSLTAGCVRLPWVACLPVRPPNNSQTPSRALRHTPNPSRECGLVQTWFYLVA